MPEREKGGQRLDSPMYFWLGAFVVFGVIEAATAGLTSIWFAVGALVTLVAAAFGASIGVQIAVFIAASAAALAVTRPLVKRFISNKKVPTNADRVLGEQAKVTEQIDNIAATGAVYVDGKTWSARSDDGEVIPVNTMVVIQSMEGVKLIVRVVKEEEK